MNEKSKRMKETNQNPYEKIIQKLEQDIRGHIKVSIILFVKTHN